jgi:hypothetical protein
MLESGMRVVRLFSRIRGKNNETTIYYCGLSNIRDWTATSPLDCFAVVSDGTAVWSLRSDRDGYSLLYSNRYQYAYRDQDSYAYGDTSSYEYTNRNSNAYGDSNTYRVRVYRLSHTNAYTNTHCNADTYRDAVPCVYCNTNSRMLNVGKT